MLWEGVEPDSSSDTQEYTGLDFAEWGKTKGHGRHEDVITFLHDQICVKHYMGSRQWVVLRQATGPPPPPPPPPPPQPQPCSRRHGGRKPRSSQYKLFHAAKDGCLACVQRLVLVEGVAADALSDTHRYSVLDFAEWGEKQAIKGRHADVISFLQVQLSSAHGSAAPEPHGDPPASRKDIEPDARREGLQQPAQGPRKRPGSRKAIEKDARQRGLQQPVQAPMAMRLMERLGWKAGQGLGARGQGITEPLAPRGSNNKKRGLGSDA